MMKKNDRKDSILKSGNNCLDNGVHYKYLGYVHIAQKWAPVINEFNRKYLVPYLN